MPTYEYQCKTCGHHFEKVQRFSENPLTECPKCAGEIRRVIHPAGVIFKGAGWYITDSRKGGESQAAASGKKDDGAKKEGDGAKKDGAATETKAAEKVSTPADAD